MAVPDVILIRYKPDHRTDTIGRYADGQFLASITWAFREGVGLPRDWPRHKRLYAVLHRFDRDGHHMDADIWFAGTWAEKQHPPDQDPVVARAESKTAELLGSLPAIEYGNIAIRPFRLEVDGVVFGLVVGGDGEYEWATLEPDDLFFSVPWDGSYDT
jgi:formate hydrogenlyase regulatory protein HycA